MAFPATYNISYYQGDTYEFEISPLDSNGDPFVVSGYTSAFKIATKRGGTAGDYVGAAESEVDSGNNLIACKIGSTLGATLQPGVAYVYDIAISKDGKEYTLLTGNINVTAQVKVS